MIALDTNILVYAEGLDDGSRRDAAQAIILNRLDEGIVLPAQVLTELYRVLRRKAGFGTEDARDAVAAWMSRHQIAPTTATVIADAMNLVARHRLGWFDAIVLCTAVEAGCQTLVSEDFARDFVWRGVTVHNPFAA